MKAIITIGIPCSGKSTWAMNQDNFSVVERDMLREIYPKKNQNRKDYENMITKLQIHQFEVFARDKKNIIVSDTNLKKHFRNDLIKVLESLGYEVEEKLFPIALDEAFKRNEKRAVSTGKYIPVTVLNSMYNTYKQQFSDVVSYTPREDKPKIYLFDIDGTLAKNEGERGWYEWSAVGIDKPVKATVDVLRRIVETGDDVVVLSGRDSVCRKETMQWFKDNDIPVLDLFMRPEGSMEKDSKIKLELFDKHIRNEYNVLGVFDDRPQVVQLWHDLGLTCFSLNSPYNFF